jgi:hypothetical protein
MQQRIKQKPTGCLVHRLLCSSSSSYGTVDEQDMVQTIPVNEQKGNVLKARIAFIYTGLERPGSQSH